MATEETQERVEELATSIEALSLLQQLDPSEATFGVMLRLNMLSLIVSNLARLCADQQRQITVLEEATTLLVGQDALRTMGL
jgi:hypothetical protein